MQENVPGYTRVLRRLAERELSLNAYAGKSIRAAFRVVTTSRSPATDDAGARHHVRLRLRDVTLPGAPWRAARRSTGWLSPSEVRPTPVYGFTVQLVAYSSRGDGHVSHATLRWTRSSTPR